MMTRATADQLLDFGAGGTLTKAQADDQLDGAVALHNILEQHSVGYLADEVGMGKTYVALGVLALFRHFRPGFRVLVIAPSENIQRKWQKEFRNFTQNNVRFEDLRVRGLDGQPARRFVHCNNLLELALEAARDADRDFFVRFSSFSLGLGEDAEEWEKHRKRLADEVPWLKKELFDLGTKSNKTGFKDKFARAVACALPVFDLVIVDEAHKLKHGFSDKVAARNRVLGFVMGRDPSDNAGFSGYGARARKVLFLSATPIEDSFRQLWNQLDVFGRGEAFKELADPHVEAERSHELVRQILIRRVTVAHTMREKLTKNLYRREWRRGGMTEHDAPIGVTSDREKLVLALVQKKVADVLNDTRALPSFQIGMLASFESFFETIRKKQQTSAEGVFDDVDQTEDEHEKMGVDVGTLDKLIRSYRAKFGGEMPHPKMDAVVNHVKRAWDTGEKSLVFVRRVASVKDLKRKLDDAYDEWLKDRLVQALPRVEGELKEVFKAYAQERRDADGARDEVIVKKNLAHDEDLGGVDTFFAWFFRGERSYSVGLSGVSLKDRLQKSVFFHDSPVAELLGVFPVNSSRRDVRDQLARVLGRDEASLEEQLQSRAARYLSSAETPTEISRFNAVQAAALELLQEHDSDVGRRAKTVKKTLFGSEAAVSAGRRSRAAPSRVTDFLERRTFFTALREPRYAALRSAISPELSPSTGDDGGRLREQETRQRLLAAALYLGHGMIELYECMLRDVGSLHQRQLSVMDHLDAVLEMLDGQRQAVEAGRLSRWGAFRELADISSNYPLIMATTGSEIARHEVVEIGKRVGRLLQRQQPVGGMAGQINGTLVQQFRMPGYPLVLISTELLQEGEDLHTFCSDIHHYGISWTPSSMEQRIGRLDRVGSQTHRRLAKLVRKPADSELLQVYYPHLEDTVEVLQVRRVLERMDTFLRLMHTGLSAPVVGDRRIDVGAGLMAAAYSPEPIRELLKTAFPVNEAWTKGVATALAVDASTVAALEGRFEAIVTAAGSTALPATWDPRSVDRRGRWMRLGTITLTSGRVQPILLHLVSEGAALVLRCTSPVGRVGLDSTGPGGGDEEKLELLADIHRTRRVRLGAVLGEEGGNTTYDLTVEDDVLLGDPKHDAARLAALLRRVVNDADALEHRLLECDAPLDTFRIDLAREGASDAH